MATPATPDGNERHQSIEPGIDAHDYCKKIAFALAAPETVTIGTGVGE
ncbi:MAG: hypothetical protein WCK55_18570 [Verrucomicrobiota bacterium]